MEVRPRLAYRYVHSWSQDEVAQRLTALAARHAASQPASAQVGPQSDTAQDPFPARSGTRIGEYERWPAGGRQPSIQVLLALAEVFGTTVDQLIDYDDYRALTPADRAAVLEGAPRRPAQEGIGG